LQILPTFKQYIPQVRGQSKERDEKKENKQHTSPSIHPKKKETNDIGIGNQQ
jgi:hypothetical protein